MITRHSINNAVRDFSLAYMCSLAFPFFSVKGHLSFLKVFSYSLSKHLPSIS